MSNQRYIITIDGPAASGKGSLAKIVSSDLNLYYMETGIYYRDGGDHTHTTRTCASKQLVRFRTVQHPL